ncbi:DUF2750 domain-containing protein [Actinokineospora auranticolor]|uniref:Uncharacterized protein DUF2750 n=1 Tax=Actinokineospora auranticolor TaxID=155976 RepID=A0A2S6GMC6_9PSEU|nr:DUF2750 domain-containing protein [Actinokineospora auranticolor]PPK66375.1 uncharacterized protein DUF2750 [Actinokineospora auranticolor]
MTPSGEGAPLAEDEARRVWGLDSRARKEYFFAAVAATGVVWAWDESTVFQLDDDVTQVPLWPHRRLAELSAEAMEWAEPPVAIAVDDLLDEYFERYDLENHEIAVLPTDGAFTPFLSLERFRVEVFEARLLLRAEGRPDSYRRAEREAFHEDCRRRADARLGLDPAARRDLAAHLRAHLAECDDRLPLTGQWAASRDLPWRRLARALNVLSVTCDCAAREYF